MKRITIVALLALTLVIGAATVVAVAILTYTPGAALDDRLADLSDQGYNYTDYVIAEPQPPGSDIHGLLSYVEYGGNRAYLFGSMHLGNPDIFPLADVAEQAMRRADAFAFEWDLSMETAEEDIVFMLEMFYHMLLPEGETLATFLPPEAHAHLVAVLDSFHYINYEEVYIARPWFLELMMMYEEIAPALGFYQDYSVDGYILDFAQGQGRTVLGLVSAEHQHGGLFDIPYEVEVAGIMTWTYRDTMIAELRRLIEAYIAQDIDALRAMVSFDGADRNNPAIAHEIDEITRRTGEFAHEIDRLLRETTAPTTFFVTIGIAHLLHDHGNAFYVLEGLGHTINPLWQGY